MCKKLLTKQLKAYHQYHTKCWTQITHFIGVPLIIFSLIILTSWAHIRVPGFFDMPLSWLLSIIVLVYYFFMDITLAAVLTVIFIIFNVIVSIAMKNRPSWISLQVFLFMFIIGWVFQFVGHFIEKKKPAFFDDFKQTLIAPLYLTAEAFFYFGLKSDLKKAIEENE